MAGEVADEVQPVKAMDWGSRGVLGVFPGRGSPEWTLQEEWRLIR